MKAMGMFIVNFAPARAMHSFAEGRKPMSDYDKRLFAYQVTMSLARGMRSKGIISDKEYAKIDTIIAKKYGISSYSIFR